MIMFRHLAAAALALIVSTVSGFAHIPQDVLKPILSPSPIRVHSRSFAVRFHPGVLDQTVTSGNTNLHYYVVDLADPLKRPLAILDADGDLVRAFVWGRGAVAQVEADGSVYYFHQDGQGSTLALSDTNAVVTDQWFYSPYGQVMNRTGSTTTPYQWIGGAGAFAESYGLYHMRARHYHPALHRFMSRDPLGIAGGGNLYAYAALNPLLFYDPYGLSPSTWDNIINGAVYGDFAADTGWGGVGSQVVIGLMPVVGQIADIRDTIANIVNVWNDPTSGAAWLGLGAAVVAWAPGLDFAKGTFRAGREIATEVGQAAFRNADEVGQAVVRRGTQLEFPFARGASVQTPGVTEAGERFVRVGAEPRNLRMTFDTPGGTAPGTYAFPESTFRAMGEDPSALRNLGDLPGDAPQYYRVLEPPAGTPIQRGIVPGGEYGGAGRVPEVIFPEGF